MRVSNAYLHTAANPNLYSYRYADSRHNPYLYSHVYSRLLCAWW